MHQQKLAPNGIKPVDKKQARAMLDQLGLALTHQGSVKFHFTPSGDLGKIEILTTL